MPEGSDEVEFFREEAMSYINVGAKDREGNRFPTKSAIKRALATDPGSVLFDPTSAFSVPVDIPGNNIPEGVKLSLVGPDPYTKRDFYGTVTRGPDGIPRLK